MRIGNYTCVLADNKAYKAVLLITVADFTATRHFIYTYFTTSMHKKLQPEKLFFPNQEIIKVSRKL